METKFPPYNFWQNFSEAILIFRMDGKIVTANNAAFDLFDISQLEGKYFHQLIHPTAQKEFQIFFEKELTTSNKNSPLELRTMLMNQAKVWLEFTSYHFNTEENETFFLSLIRDISKRKKIENDLIQNEDRYRTLFNNTNDAMFVCYLNYGKTLSNFIEINEAAIKWLGYSREELLHMNPSNIMLLNSESKSLEIIDKLLKSDQAIFESMHITRDGSKIPVEISSHLFTFGGRQAVLFISRDLTQRQKFETKLRATGERLRQLAIHLQSIREEERKLIAREIHDELGQVLTVLKIKLSLLPNKIPEKSSGVIEQIHELIKLVENAIESVHEITSKLRPDILDELGLVSAIDWQTKQFSDSTGIACNRFLPKDEIKLDSDRATALFRILQESLTNVARHSNASRVNVILNYDSDNLLLEITDNGKGITNSQINNPNSLGILGMKERALVFGGEFIIKSSMESGTTVQVKFPIDINHD